MINMQSLFNVQGMTALITGGSGQLGGVMARGLAQAGANVAVLSLHAETSEKVAEHIRTEGGQAIGVACDVLDRNALEQTRALVTSTYGPIDILINAAVVNFTQWLAVYMAQEYSPRIRVNGIAPGFFLTEQNRYLLTDKQSGALTQRGQSILSHTPMNRLGMPEDLLGTLLWLVSPASAFVTGIVVPVDGGFSSYTGV